MMMFMLLTGFQVIVHCNGEAGGAPVLHPKNVFCSICIPRICFIWFYAKPLDADMTPIVCTAIKVNKPQLGL